MPVAFWPATVTVTGATTAGRGVGGMVPVGATGLVTPNPFPMHFTVLPGAAGLSGEIRMLAALKQLPNATAIVLLALR